MTALVAALQSHAPPRPVEVSPIVDVRGLSKRFAVRRTLAATLRHPRSVQRADVLCDVTFGVRPGELFGLLGPNGAGKTTLFKILSTLVTPDRGSVRVAGHDLAVNPAAVREALTPVIADDRSLSWRLSARENLRVYGTLYGWHGQALATRIDDVLGAVRLHDTGGKMVGQFSAGMKQRLLIARALLHRPRILLLDEPTRSLDPISAREFRQLLRDEIIGAQGCTVLLATHNPEEALGLCDRVAILDRGRLVALDAPPVLAAELMGERYRVWTPTPAHPAWAALRRARAIADIAISSDAGDESIVEIRLSARRVAAADVLASLVDSGVVVSRFEQRPYDLADLIDRAIRMRGQASHA